MEMLRFILGVAFIIMGLLVFVVQLIGVFKFKYVLNRMHAAAMCDTFVLMLALLGVCVYYGFSLPTAKAILVIILLWFASPVASHLIARLEVTTNQNLKNECEMEEENND